MTPALSMAVAILALVTITWGPTLLAYRRKRQRGAPSRMPGLLTALAIELAAVIVAGVVVDGLGAPNPGAYLLAIALLVGAVGGQVYARHQK